jgi:hypothetical protein
VPAQNVFAIQEKSAVPLNAVVPLPRHVTQTAEPSDGVDGIAHLIAIDASAAKRALPGSLPVLRPGFH